MLRRLSCCPAARRPTSADDRVTGPSTGQPGATDTHHRRGDGPDGMPGHKGGSKASHLETAPPPSRPPGLDGRKKETVKGKMNQRVEMIQKRDMATKEEENGGAAGAACRPAVAALGSAGSAGAGGAGGLQSGKDGGCSSAATCRVRVWPSGVLPWFQGQVGHPDGACPAPRR